MFDNSENQSSQLTAVEGDRFLVCCLPCGSKCLAPALLSSENEDGGIWTRIKKWLRPQDEPKVVCLPPGTRLIVRHMSPHLQQLFGINATEEVTFVRLDAEAYHYSDAIRFSNGQTILLQRLEEGQTLSVTASAGD